MKLLRKKLKKIVNIILIFIFLLGIFHLIRDKNNYKANQLIYSNKSNNIFGIDNFLENKMIYSISFTDNVTYEENIEILVKIENFDDNNYYTIKIYIDSELKIEQNLDQEENIINLKLNEEGENKLNLYLYNNNEEEICLNKSIYYIQPYKTQFLDTLSNKSIQTHYIDGTWEKYDKSIIMVKNAGFKKIKSSFLWTGIEKSFGQYDFSYYDQWIKRANELGIEVIACVNRTGKWGGENIKIDSNDELNHFNKFFEQLTNRYANIKKWEILNEPNLKSSGNGLYITDEDWNWYSKIIKLFSSNNKNIDIIPGGLSNYSDTTDNRLSMDEALNKLNNNNVTQISKIFSYHVYDYTNESKQDIILERTLKENKKKYNDFGGFLNTYITEYGLSSYSKNKVTEEIQARKLVQQTIIMDKYNIALANIYNFWNTGNNKENIENNFGLVNNDYIPKKSFYSIKNYLQNTNGAEYIGTVNISDGLESHVYDKDGKPVIITWSENSTNNIQIDYKDFTAKDLYGKDIQPDENGKLTITTSPVYLYDVDYNYFYKAISNVATSKYDEFKEKFTTEISQISGFEEKINQRQNYIQSVANTQKLMQNTAITAMKSHYELGNIILKAYEEGQLKVEPVKISSMLDMINDIGNSYEDLVTVSVNNTINSVMKTLNEANVDSSELVTTKQKIDETENLINTNTDVEIIYPTKILQFSKDCYEKADYINSLEEQNDIKAGLIISNNLHAQLLANWANKFASIQINNNINKYIAQNPVTIEYSETNITNKSVKATIKTNAEIQITNNSNSKEYVFEQNGSFTFEYTIKGQAKQITAKVTNIDKTSPTINGVIDRKLYTSKITPTITDENLDTIKLILNGEEVKNFKSGTTLTDEGFYTLTATDKAGNKTQISFQIMENNNQNYIIQDNIIKNISEQTKKSDFDNKLKLGITYKIARNEKEISNTDSIATGDILTTSAGDKYTIIVTGDMNKDGKLNLKDLVKMRKYLLDGNNLDENEMLSADCNFDGKINLKDLVKMRLMLLNQDATK